MFVCFVFVFVFLTISYRQNIQLCPTLCDPIDSSPPSSSVPGILQARTLEWVAISLPNARKWKLKVKSLSRARLPATPWTAAYQAPLSMGFSRQEDWSGLRLPSPRKNIQHCKLFQRHLIVRRAEVSYWNIFKNFW